jgi:hypothetical protein
MIMLSESHIKTMLCLKCGFINRLPAEFCERCKNPLIKSRKLPPRMGKNLERIKGWVQKFQAKEISADDFIDSLNKLKASFNRILNKHMEMQISEDLLEENKDELMLGRTGIARYISAVESLIYYAKTSNLEALEEGLQYAEEANDMLNKALTMNWESFRAFQESIEEHIMETKL